jgi:ATP-dependent DNA ligase
MMVCRSDLLRYRRHDHAATICAFDLIEVDGTDLLRHPIEERKERLARLLHWPLSTAGPKI